MIKLLKLTLLMIILTSLSCSIQESYPKGDMTLIFYLADDTYGSIGLSSDISELTMNANDISDKRVVMLYDGPAKGDSSMYSIDNTFGYNSRKIKLSDANIPTESTNEINMADPATLTAYLKYIKKKIPSDYYALYFGAHGAGYRSNFNAGLHVEEKLTMKDEVLEVTEINKAITESGGVDLLVFDVCLMGNLENIYEFKDSVDYIIASPETIPGPGNNYTYLTSSYFSDLETTPYNIGKSTLNSFYRHYDLYADSQPESDIYDDKELLSMYDVKAISGLIESDNFGNTIKEYVEQNGNSSEKFGEDYVQIDLENILSNITTADNDDKKLISIYYAKKSSFNEAYSETSFSQLLPTWTEYLKNR